MKKISDILSILIFFLLCKNLSKKKVLDAGNEGIEEDGGALDVDIQRKGKCVVIKTSTRQVCLTQQIFFFFFFFWMNSRAAEPPLIFSSLSFASFSCMFLTFNFPFIFSLALVLHQTYFLPVIGLVDAADLQPGDLVGVNKDSYLILEKLPAE
jgi:hypothetical protein